MPGRFPHDAAVASGAMSDGHGETAAVRRLRWHADLGPADVPEDLLDWLRVLGRPTLIHVPGRDATRTRVVSTLLHGNEPSGLSAMARFLREDVHPMVDLLLFVGGVETALAGGGFAFRALPGHRDLNRCWRPPFTGREGGIARVVLDAIAATDPECLVDLHNNTGHNPAYGVAFHLGHAERSLVSLFADRVVHTPIELGTLVEAALPICPSVTVECGRSGDPVADATAWQGLLDLAGREIIDFARPERPVTVLVDPIRVELRPGTRLAFGEAPDPSADVTISGDIDRHNFDELPAGVGIGWLTAGRDWPFVARGPDGSDASRDLIARRGNRLETARPLTPIMMTTDREVALSDCLFYAVSPARADEPAR